MPSDFLDKLAAGPLCDPNKIYLPKGRRGTVRKRSPDELEIFREERQAKQERLNREHRESVEALLAYYAKTTVPADRIAAHLGIEEAAVLKGLARHGRKL